jgi:cGMP-dependent protein kinase 1
MKYYTLDPKSIVFSQGSLGNCLFVVDSGKLDVIVDGINTQVLSKGESFGELALMQSSPRSSTVITQTFTHLWGLTREDFRSSVNTMNDKRYQETRSFISGIPLFEMLTPSQKESLLELFFHNEHQPGEKIVVEGDPGDLLFVVIKGTVRCTIKGRHIRDLGKGESFGEQALLHNTPRSATITAVDHAETISLHREHVVKVLGTQLQEIIYKNSLRISLEKSQVFKDLTKHQAEMLVKQMKITNHQIHSILIPKGAQKGNKLLIVLKGCVSYSGAQYGLNTCIGDTELLKKPIGKYEDSIISVENTDIGEITREEIEKTIQGDIKTVLEKNIVLSILKQVNLFRTIPLQKFEYLVKALSTKEFKSSQYIFNQGDPGLNLFIIKEGYVEIIVNGLIVATLEKFDYFGERAILFKENRTASARAKDKVVTWVLNKEDFLRIIDAAMRQNLLKRIQLQDNQLSIENLNIIKLLGKGTYGNVFLAINTKTSVPYAIKTISKKVIEAYKIQENLIQEKKLLTKIDHSFIVKFAKTLKDSDRIYFIFEYIRGVAKGLYEVIKSIKK